jgi:hypothetical protein
MLRHVGERGRGSVKVSLAAVGIPAAAMTSLENAFEASIRAAAAPGPATSRPSRAGGRRGQCQRYFGPDDDEVDAVHVGRISDAIDVVGGDGEVGGQFSSTGVPGRAAEDHVRVFAVEGPA